MEKLNEKYNKRTAKLFFNKENIGALQFRYWKWQLILPRKNPK